MTLRRLNPFYLAAFAWLLVLMLYSLGWSDLNRPLDSSLVFFVPFSITIYLFLGFILSRKSEPAVLDVPVERTKTATLVIMVVFISGIFMQRSFPVINILTGRSYDDGLTGIPFIGAFFTAYALFHSFRLSYLYVMTKKRQYLVEYLLIFAYFLLMIERQNIAFCALGFALAWFLNRKSNQKSVSIWKKLFTFMIILIAIGIALFVFGVIGNTRYGLWTWDDSSMISAVGYMNDKWPTWLPKQYFWFYTYMASPLANLNNNVQMVPSSGSIIYLLAQFFPSSITGRMGYVESTAFLFQPSLNVSTAYVQPYLGMGMGGIYVYFFVTSFVAFLVLYCPMESGSLSFAIRGASCYFLLLMVFDNPSTYLTTGYLMIISVTCCFGAFYRHTKLVKR